MTWRGGQRFERVERRGKSEEEKEERERKGGRKRLTGVQMTISKLLMLSELFFYKNHLCSLCWLNYRSQLERAVLAYFVTAVQNICFSSVFTALAR